MGTRPLCVCLGPLPLSNINSSHEMIANELFKINVTWDSPKYTPDYYEVTLNLYSNKGRMISQTVPGVSFFLVIYFQ